MTSATVSYVSTRAPSASAPRRTARPTRSTPIPPRRLLAFLAMCFGMFMAFLDIQIVSSSLAEIQAGLSASADEIPWVQTSYLIAEVIAIPLSGFLSRALGTRILFADLGCRLYACEHHVRDELVDRQHDRVAGAAGIHRRRHGADGVRLGLSDIPGPAAKIHRAGRRPDRDARADHRADRRRLPDRRLVVALAVFHQCGPRHRRDRRDDHAGRLRQADFALLQQFRLVRAASRMAGFLGALEYVLEEGPRYDWFDDDTHRAVADRLGASRRSIFFARVLTARAPIVDLRAFANRNFAVGSLFSFVLGIGLYGLTYLYPVYLGAGARLRRADDRRDDVRLRPRHVRDRADRRPAQRAVRSALRPDRRLCRCSRSAPGR